MSTDGRAATPLFYQYLKYTKEQQC